MTSKERVRAAITYSYPDRTPAAFESIDLVKEKLLKHYGFTNENQLLDKFEIDIVSTYAPYTGPLKESFVNKQGHEVVYNSWEVGQIFHTINDRVFVTVADYPLAGLSTLKDLEKYSFPNPDNFNYEFVKRTCEKHKDKAIIVGHEGPFQMVTELMDTEEFCMLMVDEPEITKALLDKMVDFVVEYYERVFLAADGQVDIFRPHDDYGTQISLMFSIPMWREFFRDNTKKLASLAHKHGAFYMQHSCGAIAPLIPEFIDCGVDMLEPLQKLPGMDPETLFEKYGGKIVFHGGIDTQSILPFGTPDDVIKEVELYIRTLNPEGKGGYILMASQAIENDVPIENIEALYSTPR